MVSIRSSQLSFTYSDRTPLFTDVDLHLESGWTGLIGPNGAGKTTLLRLLKGDLVPESGQVILEPRSARVELCRQDVESLDPGIRDFAYDWDRTAQRLRGRLRLDPVDIERWPTMSPGERRRWQIASALSGEPEILLLDEPTNHLDAEGRGLLLDALQRFRGLGIVVSHDRQFLNELTRSTLRIRDGEVRLWKGAYDAARAAWLAEEKAVRDAYSTAREEERKIRRRLHKKRMQRQKAASRISPRSRMKGPRDHDARSLAAKNRVASAENRLGRQVGILRRELDKRERHVRSFHIRREKGGSIFVDFEPSPRHRLLRLDLPELRPLGGEGEVLLRDVHLAVDRETRVEISGRSGAGKTTLLSALFAVSTLAPDRLLYLPQELGTEESRRLLEDVRQLPIEERGRVLELVATLGVDPERLLASESPSPGEARKLMLAFGLGRRVWALLLDEPTNHLDLPAIERLEQALADYPGALVLVTHDAGLARSCTDEVWRLAEGRVETISQDPAV